MLRSNRILGLPLFSLGFLGTVILFSWSHFLDMGARGERAPLFEGRSIAWTLQDLGTATAMWGLMMAGMMLPSVGPWVWSLSRAWASPRKPVGWFIPIAFTFGYLSAWLFFSAAAAVSQWFLQARVAGFAAESRLFLDGTILILAGLYQWSGFKDRCLSHCRSPVTFFLSSWRPGVGGAVQMGLRHGLFCVGCCWLLMMLAFVVGVMNVLWMMLLTIYVFVDHSLLKGRWIGYLVGGALMVWGFGKMLTGEMV